MSLGITSRNALALLVAGVAGAGLVRSVVGAQEGAPPVQKELPPAIDLSREHRPGKIVYRMQVDGDLATKRALEESVGAVSGKRIYRDRIFELVLAPGADLRAALIKLNADPRVKYAQPSWIYRLENTPNDPSFQSLWGMNQANDADIDAPEAWDTATDATAATVAVIDTGIQWDHVDLAANMWINPDEIAGNGIDDDLNGWVDDIYGVDTVNNDGNPFDDHGHGTHCAGTIGAVGNNAIGVTGVCWNARIVALKFLDASGSGDTADALEAIDYCVQKQIHLSSNSWGGYGVDTALYDGIDDAGSCGHLFIAAAGNSAINIEGQNWLPGGYDLDNVLCVAASNSSDGVAWFSNWGPISVDLAAPGDGIYSTYPTNSYATLSGTSMATPHVAGVATMLFALSGTRYGLDVKDWILNSADPIGAWSGLTVTGGRLNFEQALAQIPAAPTLPSSGVLFSLKRNTTVAGHAMDKWDVWHLDPVTGTYTLVFDPTLLIPLPKNVDAMCVLPDGSMLLSFAVQATIPCLFGGPNGDIVEDEDLVRFVPYQWGASSFGHFEFYFDGSDVGLDAVGENVDALAHDGSGNLLISVNGALSVPGVTGRDEDVVLFVPTSLGKNTAGSWSMFLNGLDADVRLNSSTEDTDAICFDAALSTLYLSTEGDFSVPGGVSGQNDDIAQFVGTSWGTNPSGTWSLSLDGNAYGLNPEDLDAIDILP
jgi:subtilisin family serine protease